MGRTEQLLCKMQSVDAACALEELAERVDIEDRNALVARTIQELARDRRTIAFCVTVAHATNLARALRHVGIRAGVIHGQLKRHDRARLLADFAAARLREVSGRYPAGQSGETEPSRPQTRTRNPQP